MATEMVVKRLFTSEIIQVSVGEPAVVYNLHKDILTTRCPYFKACLSEGFKETSENLTVLRDVDADAFDQILAWIYQGEVFDPMYGQTDEFTLVKAYIVADRFCMEDLQNNILTIFFKYTESNWTSIKGMTHLADEGMLQSNLYKLFYWRLWRDLVQKGLTVLLADVPGLREYIESGGEQVLKLMERTAALSSEYIYETEQDEEALCRWHDHKLTPICKKARKEKDKVLGKRSKLA